jgi:hypothetical protein
MRKIVSALAAGTLLLAGAADGAVLCQKRSGAVLVRAACKKKETVLDLSQFGALGPKGDKGDTGDAGSTGAPGTARAYGHVLANGTVDGNYANAGIVGARTTPTYFCIKLDPSIDAAKAMAVVSVEETNLNNLANGGNSDLKVARFVGASSICTQGNELTVATASFDFNAGALNSAGIGPFPFYIVVP